MVTAHSCLLMEDGDGEGARDMCYFQAVKRLSPTPAPARHDHSMLGGIVGWGEMAPSSTLALQND